MSLAACGGGNGSIPGQFQVYLADGDMSVTTGSARIVGDGVGHLGSAAQVEGLRLGRLTIVAYDHRPDPGQLRLNTVETNDAFSYLAPLVPGDKTTDILLEDNGVVDINALASADGDYRGHPGAGSDYVTQVGYFDVDMLEVRMERTGILYDLAGSGNVADYHYFGEDADENGYVGHPLQNYPAYASVPDTYTPPIFPDWKFHSSAPRPFTQIGVNDTGETTSSILYVRRDWFAETREIRFTAPPGQAGFGDIGFDSLADTSPLSAEQRQLLLDYATRNSFQPSAVVVVIPMDFTRIIYDDVVAGRVADPMPAGGVEVPVQEYSLQLSMSISQVLDEDWSNPEVPTGQINPTGPTGESTSSLRVDMVASPGTYELRVDGRDFSIPVRSGLTTPSEVANEIANELSNQWNLLGDEVIGLSAVFEPSTTAPFDRVVIRSVYPIPFESIDGKLKDLETSLPQALIVYAGDADSRPFGMEFDVLHDVAVCPSGEFEATSSCHNSGERAIGCCVCPTGTVFSAGSSDSMRTCK